MCIRDSPGVDVEEYSCQGYEKFFFYPSRITPEKRFELAIEAFKKSGLSRRGFRLVIAGSLIKGNRGHFEYYERIREMIKGIGEVRLDVPRSELLDLYSRCYAVLFTPINEDFGIVPLEAMASGKPVIAVDEGGPRETVVHEKTGYLCKNVDEIAVCMALLANDPSLKERMGKEGRERVRRHFSWGAFFSAFDRSLKEASR